jgi:hypothetical protein
MESNQRYYERRAAEELRAAARAITPEARERRRALAELFASKAAECVRGAPAPVDRTLIAVAAA